MAEFYHNDEQYVDFDEKVYLPKIEKCATVRFDVYEKPSFYKVVVKEDGSWVAWREW